MKVKFVFRDPEERKDAPEIVHDLEAVPRIEELVTLIDGHAARYVHSISHEVYENIVVVTLV